MQRGKTTTVYEDIGSGHSVTSFSHLYKDSEEDDHNGSCDEESFLWEVIDQEDEGEADCPSQASVGDDELISKGHSVPPQLVDHSSQQENTFRGGRSVEFSILTALY